MGEKSYVCGYKHCVHKGEKVLESEAIIIGKKRYHKDCVKLSETIKLIKDTYLERMDSETNPVQLLSVINTMVFKKGVDADYILFALEDTCNKGFKFKAPYTMYYFEKNLVLKEKWRKLNADRQ